MARTCLTCGKDISHKHPNAKFCTNKGRRNCKDRYHNLRGLGPDRIEDDYEEDEHPFSADALGQW